YGALRSSSDPSNNSVKKPVSNVNFGIGTVDPNVAAVKIGPDGKVCFDASNHTSVHFILDQMAVLDGSVVTSAQMRLADTRPGSGFSQAVNNKLGPGETLCVAAQGQPGDVGLFNITMVEAEGS